MRATSRKFYSSLIERLIIIPGTGKTLAYLAPVVHHLREDERKHGVITRLKRPRACIVVPGRELAIQVLVSIFVSLF